MSDWGRRWDPKTIHARLHVLDSRARSGIDNLASGARTRVSTACLAFLAVARIRRAHGKGHWRIEGGRTGGRRMSLGHGSEHRNVTSHQDVACFSFRPVNCAIVGIRQLNQLRVAVSDEVEAQAAHQSLVSKEGSSDPGYTHFYIKIVRVIKVTRLIQRKCFWCVSRQLL